MLSEKYDIPVYSVDAEFETHRKMSNAQEQPSMNHTFKDADEFFGRSVEEYRSWLLSNTREQLGFILLDLIKLSQHSSIVR